MPFAKVNEIDLYYEIHGSGKPVVFLSGFSTHHLSWAPFIEPFKESFQLILLDHRGAGQSSAPPPPYTIEMMASDTISLLDHLGTLSASMVGSSMGTTIVQSIAHRYPDRIDKGALIAPFPKLPATSLLKSFTTGKLIQAGVPLDLVVETAIPWLFSRDFLSKPNQMKEKIEEMTRKNRYPQSLNGFMGQLAALREFDATSFLKEIKTPLLLLAGEEDLSTPLWCAQLLHTNLQHSTLHTFPRTGHMIHHEKREEVISLIKQFLQ